MDDEAAGRPLRVGDFARLSGLTPKALRHYDRIGLLRPLAVDAITGYRLYHRSQLPDARLIRVLRRLDLPLGEVRALLATGPDGEAFRTALKQHRARLEAQLVRAQRILHDMDHLTEGGPMAIDEHVKGEVEGEVKERLARGLFNRVWSYLEQVDRSADDDAAMIHAAHASCSLWMDVGTPVNFVRGEWQCARVYATVGRPEPALYHAGRALEMCRQHGIGDFDIAAAYEGMARASAVAGDADEAERWKQLATTAAADIADEDDRAIVLADIESIPDAASRVDPN
jgi:DNA-binding transcriptional MerR regulator